MMGKPSNKVDGDEVLSLDEELELVEINNPFFICGRFANDGSIDAIEEE
ncbi:hypothetical protein [Xanthomonas hortorum]|nr:hypothetical protein [Xanthomonas hortorum]